MHDHSTGLDECRYPRFCEVARQANGGNASPDGAHWLYSADKHNLTSLFSALSELLRTAS
jgi:hypothetical protein